MATDQLYPEVIDASDVVAKPTSPIYLPIGVEGQADAEGSGAVGTIYKINTPSDAATAFGPTSTLTKICTAVCAGGAAPLLAVASAKGSAPDLTDRQTVWDDLSSDPTIRIRITDSETQADLAALANSCEEAELVDNKQFAIVGMPTTTDKAGFTTAASAIASKRGVFVGPGVYDASGTLRGGSYAAACVAAEVAKNSDPSNDLDLWQIPYLTGIEKDTNGNPLFRKKVASGIAVNDFEDLLQDGVSPLSPSFTAGGVMTTHLRMCYVTDSAWDALSTRIIVDQVFLDVKNLVMTSGWLRRGNTNLVRMLIKAGVEALLNERTSWLSPVGQSDGTEGFQVSVTASSDQRQVIVAYSGEIVRGIQTILVAGNMQITV